MGSDPTTPNSAANREAGSDPESAAGLRVRDDAPDDGRSPQQSADLVASRLPSIVIASSGMATGGRVHDDPSSPIYWFRWSCYVLPRDRRQAGSHPAGRRERAVPARRRLESEFQEIADGRRCKAMHTTLARMVEGTHRPAEEHRLARHLKRCHSCRHRAPVLGLQPTSTLGALRDKAAAPASRSHGSSAARAATAAASQDCSQQARTRLRSRSAPRPSWQRRRWWVREARNSGVERSGGIARRLGESVTRSSNPTLVRGESQRGIGGPATDGERAGERQTSGRRPSGPAGGRAGGSDDRSKPSGGSTPRGRVTAAPACPTRRAAPVGARHRTPPSDSGATPSGPGAGAATGDHPARAGPDAAGGELPVPDTGVPLVDGATGGVQDLTDGLQNSLP